jgi:hypothetical protein
VKVDNSPYVYFAVFISRSAERLGRWWLKSNPPSRQCRKERMFYAKDPFGNPISFVDQATVFRGTAD